MHTATWKASLQRLHMYVPSIRHSEKGKTMEAVKTPGVGREGWTGTAQRTFRKNYSMEYCKSGHMSYFCQSPRNILHNEWTLM